MIEVVSMPAIIGSICSPDAVGLTPLTTCRYTGKYVTDPNSATLTMSPSTDVTLKVEFSNNRGGRIGSFTARSANANTTSAMIDTTIRPITIGEFHGYAMPPPPSPCTARIRMSWNMLRLIPQRAQPARNNTIADCSTFLRPWRSPSLP
jgi:hypothetical protein